MGLISDDFNVFHLEDQLGIFWSQWGWGGRNKEKKTRKKISEIRLFPEREKRRYLCDTFRITV